jgi:transcriptional regulator NrdR family protein
MLDKKALLGAAAFRDIEEKIKLAKEAQKKESEIIIRYFVEVFDTAAGREVLEHLDKYAHSGFPDYANVYQTYAKAGQQKLVDHIRAVLKNAKEEPSKKTNG